MTTAKKIEELRAKIDELEAQLKAESEPMFDEIKFGDTYYFVGGRFINTKDAYSVDSVDEERVKNNNAFKDEKQAQACADYLKDRFWFVRKSIEFADGYEFVKNKHNHFVLFDTSINEWCYTINNYENRGSIYMTKESAIKFCEWLNKHKPEGF